VSARAGLEREILAWMGEPVWCADEARFDSLARRLFAFHFEHCAPFRRFCQGRGRPPERVSSWRQIPCVPTGAFKELALRSFPEERTQKTFRTSGTSATAVRGALHLDTLALYEASLAPAFRRHLLWDGEPLLVMTPPPEEAPDSSLSHMFGALLRGAEGGFYVRGGALEAGRLIGDLSGWDAPVVLCGTAFAFVHLLDALAAAGRRLSLAPGSRAMETGGFKGRSRELSRDALYREIEACLGIPRERIVNQYGMTELGSQFYDSVLLFPGEPRRKLEPPWARVRIVDPETGEEAAPGAVGSIAVVDLANTGSVLAVQTADLGLRAGDGFQVLGREPGAELRGCAIAADELLAGAAP